MRLGNDVLRKTLPGGLVEDANADIDTETGMLA
jgi:hypothetical protein